MEDTNEEYLLKWNSHHAELVSEFLDLCKVTFNIFIFNSVYLTLALDIEQNQTTNLKNMYFLI